MDQTGTQRPTRIRTAVIGCGAISHQHLPFLATSPFSRLVGVCDTSKATAIFARDRYGAADWFTDAREMLRRAKPEVVHVLTPPHTHVELLRLCLEAGAHAICEKPIASSATETTEILQYAAQHDRVLLETRNLLFNDPAVWLNRLLEAGKLGAVREVDILLTLNLPTSSFGDLNLTGPALKLPGGAVHDFLPHLAYLLLHFLGAKGAVDRVEGTLANLSGNPRVGYDHLEANLQLGVQRGRLRIFSDVKPDSFRIWVRGSRGSAETDFYQPFLRIEGGDYVGKLAPLEQISSGARLISSGFRNLRDKALQHDPYHGIPRMLKAYYQTLRDGAACPLTSEDIIAVASLVDRLVSLPTRHR